MFIKINRFLFLLIAINSYFLVILLIINYKKTGKKPLLYSVYAASNGIFLINNVNLITRNK